MHDTGEGYNVGHPQKFLGALLQNAATSGKDPIPEGKTPSGISRLAGHLPSNRLLH